MAQGFFRGWRRVLPMSALALASLSGSGAEEMRRLPPVDSQNSPERPVQALAAADAADPSQKVSQLGWFHSAAVPRKRFEFDFLRRVTWSDYYDGPPVVKMDDEADREGEASTPDASPTAARGVGLIQAASKPTQAPLPTPQAGSEQVGSGLDDTSAGAADCAAPVLPAEPFYEPVYAYAPPWYWAADALFLCRSANRDIKIVEMGTGTPPRGQRAALLTTDDLDYDPAWGPRLTLGRQVSDTRRFEITYFGFHHWVATGSFDGINGPGFAFNNIDVPFDANITSDFDGGQFVQATYASEIQSVEANLLTDTRWDLNQSVGWPWYYYVDFLGGFRYIRLSEEFDLRSTDANDTSNYLIDANNDMFGGQIGILAGTYFSPLWSWNFTGKIGILANMAEQDTLMRDDDNTVLMRDFRTKGDELAFFTEMNVGVAYDLRPNLAVTAGYMLLWIDGVALAPEQLDFSTTPTSGSRLNQNGDILIHGGFVGLRGAF